MDAPWLSADEEQAWRAFRRLLVALPARIGRDLAHDSGLSPADYEVLSTLSEKPDRRWALKDLAAKMEWSRSRLSHHAARMQARGLIDKEPDPQDARGCILHLTDVGYRVLAEAAPHHVVSVRSRFLDQVSSDELAMLRKLSTRIADLPD
ncbi:DNA-binding transcriptional regulator, MarR family [Micromonospora phaseoli]|uniref:DNA-binding transcriptional regulator, MarR family n=1 Tax=Micromonospora phaseoli TaxID=1144548 RepID=A0A1H6VV45_9ACTN|nr:MarR family winged helix-turn-helix transcriptional regulator [Micromonospora phaseoli]PZV93550.1 MarR family transcriptional regulator [Micromonospora phaseoli]GIJ80180.1 MarR family transcriptional regulator [Micromonospora phaseoli]SEJ04102.1 DNA-binding transcriptional regulator, MarR family [Micromonospora phaseoli]